MNVCSYIVHAWMCLRLDLQLLCKSVCACVTQLLCVDLPKGQMSRCDGVPWCLRPRVTQLLCVGLRHAWADETRPLVFETTRNVVAVCGPKARMGGWIGALGV